METWQRIDERKHLWRLIQRGKNIALFGPRRLGKTHLMHLLEEDAPEKGFQPVFVDLQDANSPAEATRKLTLAMQDIIGKKAIWIQLKTRIGNFVGGDPESEELTAAILKVGWEDFLHGLLKVAAESETPLLLLLDEVSVCLASSLAADKTSGTALLRQLRSLRSAYPKVRWLLTGSMGIDQIADHYGLTGTLNDLEPFGLDAFNRDQACDFVNHLSREYRMPELNTSAHEHLQRRLGWLSPHYIERLVLRIEEVLETSSIDMVDVSVIDKACEQLLQHPYSRLFSDWPDHINRNYPEEAQNAAHRLLRVLCRDRQGETLDTLRSHPDTRSVNELLCSETLAYLKNDGYIQYQESSARYQFVFGLLREYWQKVYK